MSFVVSFSKHSNILNELVFRMRLSMCEFAQHVFLESLGFFWTNEDARLYNKYECIGAGFGCLLQWRWLRILGERLGYMESDD